MVVKVTCSLTLTTTERRERVEVSKPVGLLESRNRRVGNGAVSGIKGRIKEIDYCVDRQ